MLKTTKWNSQSLLIRMCTYLTTTCQVSFWTSSCSSQYMRTFNSLSCKIDTSYILYVNWLQQTMKYCLLYRLLINCITKALHFPIYRINEYISVTKNYTNSKNLFNSAQEGCNWSTALRQEHIIIRSLDKYFKNN